MELYAIKITKSNLVLCALLNAGVVPKLEKKPTWLIFDATWNSDVPNEIITERELYNRFDIRAHSPLVLRIKPE